MSDKQIRCETCGAHDQPMGLEAGGQSWCHIGATTGLECRLQDPPKVWRQE